MDKLISKPLDLIDAMATLNGDPFIIETDEQAEEIYSFIEQCNNYRRLTSADGEDFRIAANRLDIDLNEYEDYIIHNYWATNGESVLICFG